MKIAAAEAVAELAKEDVSDQVKEAYDADHLKFGKNYILPKMLDDRLLVEISAAIVEVAIEEELGEETPEDIDEYREELEERVEDKQAKV